MSPEMSDIVIAGFIGGLIGGMVQSLITYLREHP
jgi:hypothetical protein